ncbi:MAG: TetR/AcrR family transcriptional regulator, partial [Sphingomonadaceae bacterium]
IRLFLHGYRGNPAAPTGDGMETIEPPVLEGGATLRLSREKLAALVEAATVEFLDHGYRGANVDRIAAEVRASKATIYRQFGNKEKLLRYVIQRDIYEASQVVLRPDEATDPDTAVANLARAALDEHLHPRNIRMHRLLIQEADLVPDLAHRFHTVREQRLGQALIAVLAAHARPAPAAPDIGAFYVLTTFAVRFLTIDANVDAAERNTYASEAARLFLHGLAPRS